MRFWKHWLSTLHVTEMIIDFDQKTMILDYSYTHQKKCGNENLHTKHYEKCHWFSMSECPKRGRGS